MPKISVIIPVYNGEKTIEETVESVLNQTFADFELIVINDGSQDATLKILAAIQDPRLKVFSYPNAGVSASRNRGIAHASGEFIAFLDADDLWTPDKLEGQLKTLQADPQAAVAYSWTDYIDETGQFLWSGAHITVNGDALPQLLVFNILETGSNPLVRKQAFAEVGGFDTTLSVGEDWDMWLRLAASYHFVTVPSPQVSYRRTISSATAALSSKDEAQCLTVVDRAFAQAPQSLQHLKQQSLAHLYQYLTARALGGYPERRKGLLATRFLLKAIGFNPSFLWAKGVEWSWLFKIIVMVVLPPHLAQSLLTKAKSLKDSKTTLGSSSLNPERYG